MAKHFFFSRNERIKAFSWIKKQPYSSKLRKRVGNVYLSQFFAKKISKKAGTIPFLGSDLNFPSFITVSYTFSEVYLNGVYYFHSNVANPVIIDLGANIGMTSIFFKHIYPEASIIAIEANNETYSFLEKNLKNYQNLTLINKAASDKEGIISFFSDADKIGSGKNSTYASDSLTKETKVNTLRLSSLINKKVDLLKIDIEGGELAVFRDLKANNSLSLVEKVILEFHFKQCGIDGLHFILETLELAGFQYSFSDCPDSRDIWAEPIGAIMIYARKKQ